MCVFCFSLFNLIFVVLLRMVLWLRVLRFFFNDSIFELVILILFFRFVMIWLIFCFICVFNILIFVCKLIMVG